MAKTSKKQKLCQQAQSWADSKQQKIQKEKNKWKHKIYKRKLKFGTNNVQQNNKKPNKMSSILLLDLQTNTLKKQKHKKKKNKNIQNTFTPQKK